MQLPPSTTVRFAGVILRQVDFRGQHIAKVVAVGSTFDGCDFRGASVDSGVLGHLPAVVYRNCNFAGAHLKRVSPLMARFEWCTFDHAALDDWSAVCAEFVSCHFAGRLVRVKFCGRPLGPCAKLLAGTRSINEFTGNDFSRADLLDCRISGGIDLTKQTWPSSSEYVFVDNLQTRIHNARSLIEADWPLGLDRERALNLLDLYSKRDYSVQQELILRRDDVYDHGPWTDRLLAVLQAS